MPEHKPTARLVGLKRGNTMNDLINTQALKKKLADAGVKYAIASYVDIHGVTKGKFVPVAHLGQMMQGSELYTGAALDGVPQDISDDEVAAMPDAEGLAI
ncbi:MAG: glutamine synthetase, partial [Pseudomonadales bacterium]